MLHFSTFSLAHLYTLKLKELTTNVIPAHTCNSYFVFAANEPTIDITADVDLHCDQAATTFHTVTFFDVDAGDVPLISITNPAAPNDNFNIDSISGILHIMLQTILNLL